MPTDQATTQIVQDALERELQEATTELSRLERQEQEIARRVAEARADVKAYSALLERRRARALPQTATNRPLPPETTAEGVSGKHAELKAESPDVLQRGRAPGNRSPMMPKRQARFANSSVADSVLTLLGAWQTVRGVDDYARGIWIIENKADLSRVKRTLNSEIGRLVKRGLANRPAHGHIGPPEPAPVAERNVAGM